MRALRAVVKEVRRSYCPPKADLEVKTNSWSGDLYICHKVLALTSNGVKRSDYFFNSYNFSGGQSPLN